MTLKNPLVYILAVLTLPLVGTVAPAATITVMAIVDFPSQPVVTSATVLNKISDQADTAGTVTDINGTVQAFIYKFRVNHFSGAFHPPGDTGNYTQGRGINNRRHVVGEYLRGRDGTLHGYRLVHSQGLFQSLDVAGAKDTIPLGTNNAQDYCGALTLLDNTQSAFVSLNQVVTMFSVPGATATFAYQLNTANQIIGYYTDANNINHGYTRDSAGNLTFPIDFPGSTETKLLGNNDSNWGVGSYTDTLGVTHGLFFITPDDIQTFDVSGATSTSINGVNLGGLVCGTFVDGTTGKTRGFLGKIFLDGTSKR
jgi:YD repeat-containing protein